MPLDTQIVILIEQKDSVSLMKNFPTYYKNIPADCTITQIGDLLELYSEYFVQEKNSASIETLMYVLQERFQPNIQKQRKHILEVTNGTISVNSYTQAITKYNTEYKLYIDILDRLEKQWLKAQTDKASSSKLSAAATSKIYAHETNAHTAFSACIQNRMKNIIFIRDEETSSRKITDPTDQFSIAPADGANYGNSLYERAERYRKAALHYINKSDRKNLNSLVVDKICDELHSQRLRLQSIQTNTKLQGNCSKDIEWGKELSLYREMHTRFVEVLDLQIKSPFAVFQNSHSEHYQNEMTNHETFEQQIMQWEEKLNDSEKNTALGQQVIEEAMTDMRNFVTHVLDKEGPLITKIYLLQKMLGKLYGEHNKDQQKILKAVVTAKLDSTREKIAPISQPAAVVDSKALENYRNLHTLSLWVLNTHRDYRRKVAFGEEPTGSYTKEVDAHQEFEMRLLKKAEVR